MVGTFNDYCFDPDTKLNELEARAAMAEETAFKSAAASNSGVAADGGLLPADDDTVALAELKQGSR